MKNGSVPGILGSVPSDMIELRLDYLKNLDEFDARPFEKFRERIIITVRDIREGGVNNHEPGRKIDLLTDARDRGFLTDIEGKFAAEHGVNCRGMIVSAHFLNSEPGIGELNAFVKEYSGVSIFTKIALRNSRTSRSKLISLLGSHSDLAVMELDGESSSRILYSILGSRLLYCHVGEKTSPGQMECSEATAILETIRAIKI